MTWISTSVSSRGSPSSTGWVLLSRLRTDPGTGDEPSIRRAADPRHINAEVALEAKAGDRPNCDREPHATPTLP